MDVNEPKVSSDWMLMNESAVTKPVTHPTLSYVYVDLPLDTVGISNLHFLTKLTK